MATNKEFDANNARMIAAMGQDRVLTDMSRDWLAATARYQYTYHFSWLGRPIIQLPQDVMALQELIWKIKPQFIVETGIAHGGSLIFLSSMLRLVGTGGKVIGIDIDIRLHNRVAIEEHPMARDIMLIEGSSVDQELVTRVRDLVGGGTAMVILDSNHTHEHVLRELELYSPLVTNGSYLVVMDTAIEDVPKDLFPNREWGPGNSPKSAVREFLKGTSRFEIDSTLDSKLLVSVAPEGYLKCIADAA